MTAHQSAETAYYVSTERALIDSEFVVGALQSTYWAGGRSREVILATLETSICFGVYRAGTNAQVGFARAITDQATFTWLCDLYIHPDHRRRGLGKRLVSEMISHPCVKPTRIFLGTKDAHGLYEQFGFVRWEIMRRCTSHLESVNEFRHATHPSFPSPVTTQQSAR